MERTIIEVAKQVVAGGRVTEQNLSTLKNRYKHSKSYVGNEYSKKCEIFIAEIKYCLDIQNKRKPISQEEYDEYSRILKKCGRIAANNDSNV